MKQKIYLIGIGGIAMANLACLLKLKGFSVSGSDIDTFGPSAELLKKHKINYFKDHSPIHIKKFKPHVVVIGNAIHRDNPSLEYVLDKQIPYQSMPETIREFIIGNKKSIVLAGTSGKTTTTAIISWILHKAGLKPTAIIGGILKNTDRGFLNSTGKYVVIEGDEYSSSFYDSSPKFLHYRPYYATINNIHSDHLDIYGNLENIFKAFQKLVKIIPTKGSLILNNNDQHTTSLIKESKSKVVTFGKNGNIWADGIKTTTNGLSFIAFNGSEKLDEIKSPLLGKHNAENILTAIALALELKIPTKKIVQAISDFKGVKRRLEIIHEKNNTIIIDDFAHNPEKVLASLSALRDHFPKHKIVAIFEPRTGSSRRNFFQNTYISSFKAANLVYISEPYKKSVLNKKEAFSSHQLAKDLNRRGIEAYALKNADDIISHLKKNMSRISKHPSIFCVMTSGEFDSIHQKLISLVP